MHDLVVNWRMLNQQVFLWKPVAIHSMYMEGGLQLTGAAVSTGVAPPTPADLLSIWPTSVVPIAIVHGHTVRCTIAAIVIWITLHSETQTDPDGAIVGATIYCVLLGPGWVNRQVILDVNVIHFVIRGWGVYIPNLNIKLKTSLWNIEWVPRNPTSCIGVGNS